MSIGELLIAERTMFAVMPFYPFSLSSLITHRKLYATKMKEPILTEKEVVYIAHQVTYSLGTLTAQPKPYMCSCDVIMNR
jgi:hypothetical protein